jgi:hypothetical protein
MENCECDEVIFLLLVQWVIQTCQRNAIFCKKNLDVIIFQVEKTFVAAQGGFISHLQSSGKNHLPHLPHKKFGDDAVCFLGGQLMFI